MVNLESHAGLPEEEPKPRLGLGSRPSAELDDADARLAKMKQDRESALLKVAARILRDPIEAQDVVQDTWLKARRAITSDENPLAGDPWRWLYTVVKHACLSLLRERSRELLTANGELPTHVAARSSMEEEHLELERVHRLLTKHLTKVERDVLLLRRLEGYSHAEVGRLLGIREATVRKRYSRALKKLQAKRALFLRYFLQEPFDTTLVGSSGQTHTNGGSNND